MDVLKLIGATVLSGGGGKRKEEVERQAAGSLMGEVVHWSLVPVSPRSR